MAEAEVRVTTVARKRLLLDETGAMGRTGHTKV
jgi:hypothetical protein